MAAGATVSPQVASRTHEPASPRCPHLVFRDVLGAPTVAALLDYVTAREADFRPSMLRDRESGQRRIDASRLECLCLRDLGPLKAPIETFVRKIAAPALAQLHLIEPAVEPREFEIATYGDGGHFVAHIDTRETSNRVRILSCVYYFATTPRRFSGGELRLHGFPTLSGADNGSPARVDIVPETDTLVVFPSWLRHEVLPVRQPSGAWADRRFSINCWIHRLHPSGGEA